VYIYGDIISWAWEEFGEVSSYTLAQEIEGLEVDTINVYINSYGGEVKEGLAIYNVLRRHKAKVKTVCDGFACSAASVVFMAGDERVMSNASLLMVHNAWTFAIGDQNQFRKEADDLETITQASINAYLDRVTINEEELKKLMNAETWISPADALEMGFATSVISADLQKAASQSVRRQMMKMILEWQAITQAADHQPAEPEPEPEPEPDPEPEQNKPKTLMAALFAGKE
jgi:ATP-dependent Clp protease protease subunit